MYLLSRIESSPAAFAGLSAFAGSSLDLAFRRLCLLQNLPLLPSLEKVLLLPIRKLASLSPSSEAFLGDLPLRLSLDEPPLRLLWTDLLPGLTLLANWTPVLFFPKVPVVGTLFPCLPAFTELCFYLVRICPIS